MNPEILSRLKSSPFRAKFHLNEKERLMAKEKGLEIVRKHAAEMLRNRVGILKDNDGKQTPFHGHPVFVAQHALALCCRGCMEKWHKISRARELLDEEIDDFSDLIASWIEKEIRDYQHLP